MAMILLPGETVLFPQPYLPDEGAELVITTQRMVRVTDAGVAEFQCADFEFTGRSVKRPFIPFGLIGLLGGITLLVIGLVAVFTNKGPLSGADKKAVAALPPLPVPGQQAGGAPPAPAAKPADDPSGAAPAADDDDDEDDDAILGQIGGLIMAISSLLLIAGGILLLRIKRYEVTARTTDKKAVTVRCKDKSEQTMILSTLGSAVTSAKAMKAAWAAYYPQAAAPAAAGAAGGAAGGAAAVGAANQDPVIPEGTDPVKALQDLKARKDAGQIDQATFDLWRNALLKKIRT